jgi:5-methylcytosine-specific restriction endonuclease McrA
MGRLTTLRPRIREADPTRKGPAPTVSQFDKNKLYGHRWRKERLQHLAQHPLCVHCAKQDRTTEAKVVDHKVPHGGDLTLFWDRDNWQSLCKQCHDRKTVVEDGGFGMPRAGR